MMKDYMFYVEKHLDILSKMRLGPDDYDGRISTRTHNKAIDRYKLLKIELEENLNLAVKVYSELLEINDIKVQFYAAANCLTLNLHTERAEEILEHQRKTGEKWLAMLAERNLKIWRREIDPNKLW
jgi:ATP-dependent protease Clp ATPase subunit